MVTEQPGSDFLGDDDQIQFDLPNISTSDFRAEIRTEEKKVEPLSRQRDYERDQYFENSFDHDVRDSDKRENPTLS